MATPSAPPLRVTTRAPRCTERVLEIFTNVSRHQLHDQHGRLVQTFEPELTHNRPRSSTGSPSPPPANLRLYLAVLRAAQEQGRRGRPETAFRLVRRRWAAWRGRAVEPLVRQSLGLASASGELPWPDAECVGGWWNRRFDPEIDLVGADRAGVARRLLFAGSIKWLGTPFDDHDLADLARGAVEVPGWTSGSTGLVVVSLSGTTSGLDLDTVDLVWGPDEIVSAWRQAR